MDKPLKETPDMAYKPNPKYSLEILKEFPELYDWLKQISRYKKVEDFVFISDYKKDELIRLKIFTKNHQYRIVAHLPNSKDIKKEISSNKNQPKENYNGYLGCIGDTRKPRAGEDWNRGNDLADGSYSKETWQEIVNDILAYELVKVVRHSKDIGEK